MKSAPIHGHARRGHTTPTCTTWRNMRRRCSDPNNKDYKDYGARGVVVCERWQSFENFLSDMGEKPRGSSIDRIDNDRGYEPGNCKWSSAREQMFNRRASKLTIEQHDEIKRAREQGEQATAVAKRYGISLTHVYYIAKNGYERRRKQP